VDASVDAVAAQKKEERELIKTALLGYGKADFLALDLDFRIWNPRQLEDAEVKKIKNSMAAGIERFKPGNLVPLAVPRGLIDPTCLTMEEGLGGDDFQRISFLGGRAPRMAALGGQHRKAALELLQAELASDVVSKQSAFEKAKGAAAKDKFDPAVLRAMKTELDTLKAKLKGYGMWGFAVYDLGAFG
jgi:hypothetical protein